MKIRKVKSMFELDEQQWMLLAALTMSAEEADQVENDFPVNAEYCWHHNGPDRGGWTCQDPDCVASPYTDEQEIQALERLDQYLDGDREVDDFSDLEEGPASLTELEESLEAGRQMVRDEAIFLGGPDV
jgi:hypothetical protein